MKPASGAGRARVSCPAESSASAGFHPAAIPEEKVSGGDGELGLTGLWWNSVCGGGCQKNRENETEIDQNPPEDALLLCLCLRGERSPLLSELTSAGRFSTFFPAGHPGRVQLSSSPMPGIEGSLDGRRCLRLNE